MMRIALLSDIHGNAVALDAVLADMAGHGPFEHIIVAGDLVWAGPWPAEVVDRVQALGGPVIQGNTDAFFAHGPEQIPDGKNEDRYLNHMAWMRARLGAARCDYLAGLPFSYRISPAPGHDLLVVHANPIDMDRAITPHTPEPELDALLLDSVRAQDWAVLAFGHVHIPFTRPWRDRLLVNVSSVGLPMDGDPRAVYAILTWDGRAWQAEHRRVFYNAPRVAFEMRNSDMPRGKHFAERLLAARYNRGGIAPVAIFD